mmetsp:Transcript_35181/g.105064  ORF Transcript_35181/g.105064 Transcript_35181/m.105064 type:complete len:302 (-) Transcript_35181:985-1890(-)
MCTAWLQWGLNNKPLAPPEGYGSAGMGDARGVELEAREKGSFLGEAVSGDLCELLGEELSPPSPLAPAEAVSSPKRLDSPGADGPCVEKLDMRRALAGDAGMPLPWHTELKSPSLVMRSPPRKPPSRMCTCCCGCRCGASKSGAGGVMSRLLNPATRVGRRERDTLGGDMPDPPPEPKRGGIDGIDRAGRGTTGGLDRTANEDGGGGWGIVGGLSARPTMTPLGGDFSWTVSSRRCCSSAVASPGRRGGDGSPCISSKHRDIPLETLDMESRFSGRPSSLLSAGPKSLGPGGSTRSSWGGW